MGVATKAAYGIGTLLFLQSLASSFLTTPTAVTLVLVATLMGMLGATLSLGRYVKL